MLIEILIFLVGLAVGSFANVCIHRLPKGESIVRPPSHCPKCSKQIGWFDNIPVLSFALLRGQCRHCHGRISVRYPIVELVSGLIWYGSWRQYEGSPISWVQIIFFTLLLIVSITDFETGLIPDRVSLFGIAVGLGSSFFYSGSLHGVTPFTGVWKSLAGMLTGGGLIYVTGLAGDWIFQRESMGGGDVKLMAMAGCFLGWEKAFLTFFTAPFFALPFALYQKWIKKEDIIPYGPFLSLASAVQFFYGDQLWHLFIFGRIV